MKYNKLVRDKIPAIIEGKGERVVTHIADDTEYWHKLKEKLFEELEEFNKDENQEEMVDILEVVKAIIAYKGWNESNIKTLQAKKAQERGGFAERIILDEA